MTPNSACYSSDCSTWSSPRDLVAKLADEFGPWTLDPCASAADACAPTWYGPESGQDGLVLPWSGRVWLNPPWRRANRKKGLVALPIEPWLNRAAFMVRIGQADLVCGLIPARTDTRWWHGPVAEATEIRLIKGRLKYGDAGNCAPFPSAVVIWTWYRPRGGPVIRMWDPGGET